MEQDTVELVLWKFLLPLGGRWTRRAGGRTGVWHELAGEVSLRERHWQRGWVQGRDLVTVRWESPKRSGGVLGNDPVASSVSSCPPQEREGRLSWEERRVQSEYTESQMHPQVRVVKRPRQGRQERGEGQTSRNLMGQSELTPKPARARTVHGEEDSPEGS